MGLAIEYRVKQALLRSVLADGTVVLLVVLSDDRCAILRNNELVHEATGDAEGIDGAVHRFMTMTQVTDVLGGDDREDADIEHAQTDRNRVARRAVDGGDPSAEPPVAQPAPRSELSREVAPAAGPVPSSPRSSSNITPPAA